MKKLARAVFRVQELSRKLGHKLFREPVMKKALAACGENVHIAQACDIKGIENITIGDGSSIGRGAVLWTTRAEIIVGKKVMFGPNVTIITGNHRIDMVGKYMADVTDQEKRPEDDATVTIGDDVWIGANATVLKGVTVAEGCVISAGAVVTKKHRTLRNLCRCAGDQDQGPLFNGRNRGAQEYNGSPVNRDCRGKLWMYGLA